VSENVVPGDMEPPSAQRAASDTTAYLGLPDDGRVVTPEGEAPPSAMTSTDERAVESLPPTSALLIVQHGPNAGSRFLLDAPRTTAGRSPQADIFLDDVTVSRKHAEFMGGNGEYAVRDVGSLNGTYVNRERISDVTALRAEDEVQIGKYRLTFHPSPHRPAVRGADVAAP
jgi:hypothetical protein